MTLTENQVTVKTGGTKNLNFLESIYYPFLLINFALTVKFLGWKEERYSSNAANMTAWQFFFFLASATIWIFPRIKTQNDINWILCTLGFEFFICIFGLNKWLQSIIYKGRVGSKISKNRNLEFLAASGLFFLILFFASFFISVVLKAYWYHTRFFWWNH